MCIKQYIAASQYSIHSIYPILFGTLLFGLPRQMVAPFAHATAVLLRLARVLLLSRGFLQREAPVQLRLRVVAGAPELCHGLVRVACHQSLDNRLAVGVLLEQRGMHLVRYYR